MNVTSEAQLRANRKWKKKNPETQERLNKKLVLRNQSYVREIKRNSPCARCDYFFDPVVMDFHHIDPKKKIERIAVLARSTRSIARIQAEIDKCILLCSNCHRLEHKHED